jgi:hypothetical protein
MKRISLYYSQLSKEGNLTGLIRTVQESDESAIGFRGSVGPRSARAEIRGDAKEGQQTTLQKQYNTQWKEPIELLKELQHLDMVKRTFEEVRIGDIFILPGKLSLLDVGMFAKVWEVVANQAKAQARAAANPKPPPIGQTKRRRDQHSNNQATVVQASPSVPAVDPSAEWGLRLFGALSQPAFLNFNSKGRMFWAIADGSSIIGDGASLVYKHGLTIPGTWHMLAILDAMAEDVGVGEEWLTRAAGLPLNAAGIGILTVMLEFRNILGRPVGSYGVTPLAIFREIGAGTSTD